MINDTLFFMLIVGIIISAGMLLKLFNITKKATKQQKKVFKLGLLFLRYLVISKFKNIIILHLKTYHKNLFFYLQLIISHLNLTNRYYLLYFNFKRYFHFNYFKKKRSIKKRLQKRLCRLN